MWGDTWVPDKSPKREGQKLSVPKGVKLACGCLTGANEKLESFDVSETKKVPGLDFMWFHSCGWFLPSRD